MIDWSCTNDDTEPILPPEITVGTVDMISAEGGEGSISYEITNPISETTLPEAKSSQEWVHSFQATAEAITFMVDANDSEPGSEPRTATLTISYPDAEPVMATITQAAPDPVKELTFTIEIVSEATDGIVANITPTLEDATYVSGLIYVDDYTTDEELIANDIQSFQEEDWMGNKGQISDYLETGTQTEKTFGAYKAGDVYIYAYGLTAEGEATSAVFKESATVFERPSITTTPDYTASYAPLEVPVEGGQYEVSFTVENPIEGAEVSYELQFGVEWVHDIVLADGKISFTVDSNEAAEPDSEPRTTSISLDYPNVASRPAINIRQAAPEEEGGGTDELTFEIEVVSLSTDGSYFNIIPSDKEATFIVDYIYAETYTTDEDVIADELKWLTEYDLETGDLMDEYFYTYRSGDVYIYALGVNADKTVTSALFKKLVNIPPAPVLSTDPDYSYSNPLEVPVEGGTFEVSYSIENPVENGEVTCIPPFGVEWVHDCIVSDGKLTFTVDSNAAAAPGSDPRVAYINLEYTGATDRATIVISQAAPAATTSTLEFEFQIESVASDGAYVTFIPSNDTDTYVVGQISLSNYTTDQAVIDSEVANVLQFGAEELNQGTLSSEYFWNWQPGEIYVYAVGITIDGTVTTPLYKQSITIPAAPVISTTPNYPFYNPLQIPVEGGTFEVSYTVENPVEGGEVTCVPPFGVDWIHDFKVYEDKVTFVVDSNENAEPGSEVRTSFFNLDYTGANNRATVNISQAVPSL